MKLITIAPTTATTTIDSASGHSISVDLTMRPCDGQVVLHSVLGDWPKSWVELARYGRPKSVTNAWVLPQWNPPSDFFVFRDRGFHTSWLESGITPRNIHGIISVTIAHDQLSFIVVSEVSDAHRVAMNCIAHVKMSQEYGDRPRRLFSESHRIFERRVLAKRYLAQ